ncbi:MAG: ATP-binding protein [Bacteroidota bacterium]
MRHVIISAALIALLLAGVLAFVEYATAGRAEWQALLVLALITFGVSLAVNGLVGKKLVGEKLRSLSSRIRSQRTTRSGTGGDALKELENEVNSWIQERRAELERLDRLESYRKEFLGNVSHELKTPIFNIQGYIHTLLDGGIDDKNINIDYLKKAVKSIDRMIAIVEDLQTITQLEKGELELDEERFDILALVRDVLDAQELRAREHGITLLLSNPPAEPVFAVGDKFRIRQALVNLVVNSVRYGRKGGETRIRISDVGNKVIVEVADNGIGISKEHLPRIFERFYRADKSRSREMGGTGLGLSIVKHIIEAHNQRIEVMSTEGVGSVFSFTLRRG